jgi:hypothetical protein
MSATSRARSAEPLAGSVASGCPSVLVNQPAEDVDAFNPISNRQGGYRCHCGGHRDVEADTAMGATTVVVLEITSENSLQVASVPNQRPVQTLGSDRTHPPLGIRVRPWRPRRDLYHVDACRGEHRIERGGELRVSIADQKPKLAGAFAEIHQ